MKRDIKVGLFVLAGLVFAGLVIFLIGDERRLFGASIELDASWTDVSGLKAGSPIRMGGLDVGQVVKVAYEKDDRVHAKLRVVRAEAERIPPGSRARIAGKGLLGDKMIEIVKGPDFLAEELSRATGGATSKADALAAIDRNAVGKLVDAAPPEKQEALRALADEVASGSRPIDARSIVGLPGEDMLGGLGNTVKDVASEAKGAIAQVRVLGEKLSDERLQGSLRGTMGSVDKVLKQVAEGEGYPNRLLTSKEEADRISRTIDNFEKISTELALLLQQTRKVVSRVETGPGFAHGLVYGDGPTKQLEQVGALAAELQTTVKGVREGTGLAAELLFGPRDGKGQTGDLVTNLTKVTADLRDVMANVKAGKGTVGALLVDPSVYEDVKTILGNVQRNDVLRALVRYSIKRDETKPAVQVSDAK